MNRRIVVIPEPMPVYTDETGTQHPQLSPSTLRHKVLLKHGNGRPFMRSGWYSNRLSAVRAAELLQADLGLPFVEIEEHPLSTVEVDDR